MSARADEPYESREQVSARELRTLRLLKDAAGPEQLAAAERDAEAAELAEFQARCRAHGEWAATPAGADAINEALAFLDDNQQALADAGHPSLAESSAE